MGVAAGMNANEDAFNSRADEANFLIRHFHEPTGATYKKDETLFFDERSDIATLEKAHKLETEAVAARIRRFIYQQYRTSPALSSLNDLRDVFPIMETLPPELQMMSSLLILQKSLETVPYLSSRFMTIQEQCRLAMACKHIDFSSGETVSLNDFEYGRGIFVMGRGCAFVVLNNNSKALVNRFQLLTAGSAFDAGKVLVEKDHSASRGLMNFLTFSTVTFIPESAISAALVRNENAWKSCGRWLYLRTILRDQEKKAAEDAV